MKCKECGERLYCQETRRTSLADTRRRYECSNGHQFFSYEIMSEFETTNMSGPAIARKLQAQIAERYLTVVMNNLTKIPFVYGDRGKQ